ncbi:chromosome 1 open reading frame 198 [Elysia marginata]|uniref:Chromosome 1 open reading frame 198 n=1 Tax=Elysia marginata TaxID=1093978 RepID=A0AAV4HYG0_9GAST|nr:chromosome 1 open reading frame 198 [Elysia marginata]
MDSAADLDLNQPTNLTANVVKYFNRTNFTNKCILSEERVFKKHLEGQWDSLPQERRDALLDLLFVNEEVRKSYTVDSDVHSATYSPSHEKPTKNDASIEESFPRLLINSGQKINVDFDNELWTWRDEHSGPFSWMSRSQQDLTLDDLEPENISKPQPKQLRVDLEDESSMKKAEVQFTHPCNSWCHDIIEDFKKHQKEIMLTPSPSLDFHGNVKTSASTEEVNPAFEGSADELSDRSSPAKEESRDNSPEKEGKAKSSNKKSKKKDQGRKSPSPKKVIMRSGSFNKSPVKKSERGKDEKLIIKGEESFVAEAYCNPVMESEWSNFVGDEYNHVPITDAPEVQIMDRGAERSDVVSVGSLYKGDQVQLIQNFEESPAQSRSSVPFAMTPDYSDWSAESTPDHKTHLLKGLKSPVHGSHIMTKASGPVIDHSETRVYPTGQKGQDFDTATTAHGQTDEMLTVFMEGNDIVVTSEEVERKVDSRLIPFQRCERECETQCDYPYFELIQVFMKPKGSKQALLKVSFIESGAISTVLSDLELIFCIFFYTLVATTLPANNMADSRAGQRRFIAPQARLLFETLDTDSEIDGNSSDDEPAASAASDTSPVSEQSIATPPPQSQRRNVHLYI